jgi:chromosome segregation ATPase
MRTRTVVVGIALIIIAIAVAATRAQEQPGILPSLLVEVRGLRAAIEQMASAGPRVQLALGRLQLQEQRLNVLITKLDGVREKLAIAQRQATQHQLQLEQVENVIRDPPNAATPEDRKESTHMLAALKTEIANSQSEIQRLTVEEASAAADVGNEQNRWNELNQRLEELERALGKR